MRKEKNGAKIDVGAQAETMRRELAMNTNYTVCLMHTFIERDTFTPL